MDFELLGPLRNVETIATSTGIRELRMSVSRAVVVLCGLLPIVDAALFFSLVGSGWRRSAAPAE